MQLPTAIETYFAAERGTDADALTRGFAPGAVVRDEGAVHVGHAEILAWRRAAKAKYPGVVSEPLERIADGTRTVIRCKVSGDFPNSPALLDFAFTLDGGQISMLEIR